MNATLYIAVTGLALVCALPAWADLTNIHIFAPQEKHVHGSTIVELPNGDLLAAWFHGSGERTANDVVIQGARLRQGETEWGPVFLMADVPDFPDCNPVLFIDPEERLWLFWIVVQANRWEHSILKYLRAEDYLGDGPPNWSWQDIILLEPGDQFPETMEARFDELGFGEGMWAEYALPYRRMLIEAAQDTRKRQIGWMTRIHPIVLPTGRILLPLYSDGFNCGLVAISDDNGATWRASGPIVGLAPIQPALARRNNGEIVAFCRDSGDDPKRILISTSQDDGETWSAAVKSGMPNPGSSVTVEVLDDGHWVLVHNDTEQGRARLAVSVSDDEGHTWSWMRYLEDSDGSFSYPSIIQAIDGRIHVTYSWRTDAGASIRHAVFDVDWVKSEE